MKYFNVEKVQAFGKTEILKKKKRKRTVLEDPVYFKKSICQIFKNSLLPTFFFLYSSIIRVSISM